MIEANAFLAAFSAQILAMSVLCPAWFIKYVRAKVSNVPAERFAQLYPGVDFRRTMARNLTRYRLLNTGIAVLGLLLLGWFFSYTQRPDWDDGPVEALLAAYFMVQVFPFVLVALIGAKHREAFKNLLVGKRTAVLQRRGLFDFVSPSAVFLAVLGYFLFAAYILYIARNPFPGFAGPVINIGMITLAYAASAFVIYQLIYGRKFNPFEPHADRMHTNGLGVKVCVYSIIVMVVFLSLNFTLVLLDLQRWEPFAQSVSNIVCALLVFRGFTAPPRQPQADGLDPSAIT